MPIPPQDITVVGVVERLALRFPHAKRDHIARTVGEEYDALADSRIRTYIPNLVEHSARGRLQHELTSLSSAA